MVDLDNVVIFDPSSATLYSARDLMMSMNGNALQLTLPGSLIMTDNVVKKKKRPTAYSRKYKAAFKKLSPQYKLKSGRWKKNGFKLAVKAAHKLAKK